MNNTIVQQSMTVESVKANAPSWAKKIDDEQILEPELRALSNGAVVTNYADDGTGDAYLMRVDAYDDDGVTLGDLEVRVWVGGNASEVTVTSMTAEELRSLAGDLQRVARQLDVIQAGGEVK